MNPALRLLEAWTTHQDYLWFLALIAWGGVIGAELPRRQHESGERNGWLIGFAASCMAGALLELVLLAQNLITPYTRLDAAMGCVQALGTGALAWRATQGRRFRGSWLAVTWVLLAAMALARMDAPEEAGWVLAAIHVVTVVMLVTASPRPVTPRAAVPLLLLPIVATHGPWAYGIMEGRSTTDWSRFAVLAAAISMAAGIVFAAEAWRRRLDQVAKELQSAEALRRSLRRAVVVLAVWLLGGFFLAVWYGRMARQGYEEALLRRVETAVLALDERALVEALGPELRISDLAQERYPNGRPVVVATVPRTRAPVYAALRAQMARVRSHNHDFRYLYIATWRAGQLLVLNSLPRTDEAITHVVHHAVTPADLERLAAGRSFVEGPVTSDGWSPQFSAKAALRHPDTNQFLGWLVADVAATRWMTTFTQARLQTMALVAAGVGLWALAVAYRLRREARDAAEQKAAAAAAADRMKSAFLAKVSHELRTPIQSVLGYGEMLESAVVTETHRGWLTALRSHGDIMLRLVNDLIDLGALQSGAFQLEPGPVEIRALVADCTTALRPAARAKGLAFECDVAGTVPAWVRADGVRLRQVLLNLLTNAVKFTPLGRVRLEVCAAPGGVVEFFISDTGPGIAGSLRARLFQPFARLDPAAGGGSGLGLALVQGLCGVMGGSVRLAENTTAGATFVVELPLPACEPPGGTPVVAEATTDVPGFAGLRILIAEDNTLVRELLVAFLRERGAAVTVAVDGVTALTLARAESPDVLLLDIALPGMDGIAVAEALRRDGPARLRIIGLSAHVGPQDEARARAAGMDVFLSKPVRLAQLAEVIVQQMQAPDEGAERITDPRLRARLVSQFAHETPGILAEMREALAATDWVRLRGRAHYLKNSADVLGVSGLQRACDRLAGLETAPDPALARRLLDAVEASVPPHFASAFQSVTDRT